MGRAGGCAEKSVIYLNGLEGLEPVTENLTGTALARACRARNALREAS
jgi:hypothetical protein